MDEPRFCPDCGREAGVEHRFCRGCGEDLLVTAEVESVVEVAWPDIPANRNRFTLLELIIIVAIVGILAAIAMPSHPRQGHGTAREKACYANMRVIMSAIEQYNMDHSSLIDVCDGSMIRMLKQEQYLKTEPQCPADPKGSGASIYRGWGMARDGMIVCPTHGTVE